MKLKILRKYPSGMTEIKEIEIETFRWRDNHTFEYVPIWNGYSICRSKTLEPYEDIVGLSI